MTRERPDGPVVAACEGDVDVYPTVEDAAGYMEGYDVIPGLWEAWDSRGYRLTVYAETEPSPVEIWFDPETSGPPELDAVATLIREHVGNVNTERYPLEIDPSSASPDQLIAELLRINQIVHAPGPILRFLSRLFGRDPVDNTD